MQPQCVRNYKSLAKVERAFRSLKTIDLQVRPIHHRTADRVRAHIFLCMLAYYVEWHMREAWRELMFADTDQQAKATRDPVAPARRSKAALAKVARHTLDDGTPAHSFATLLDELATIVRNTCRTPRRRTRYADLRCAHHTQRETTASARIDPPDSVVDRNRHLRISPQVPVIQGQIRAALGGTSAGGKDAWRGRESRVVERPLMLDPALTHFAAAHPTLARRHESKVEPLLERGDSYRARFRAGRRRMNFPATPGGRMLVAAMALTALLVAEGCRSRETVRFGIVVTDDAVVAAQLAASEINASGGIQGHPLELRVIADDSSTRASLSLAAAEELSRDETVIGVVGHSNSSASLSAAQIYNARHVAQIAPTSSAPLLRQVGPYTFRLVPSDVHQARFLADQVAAGPTAPRIALFFVNDDYGRALHEEFRALLEGAGVPVVYDAPYIHEEPLPDPAATARRMAQEGPDLLVWIGRAAQLRQLLPELRLAIPGIRILASDGIDEAMTYRNEGASSTACSM